MFFVVKKLIFLQPSTSITMKIYSYPVVSIGAKSGHIEPRVLVKILGLCLVGKFTTIYADNDGSLIFDSYHSVKKITPTIVEVDDIKHDADALGYENIIFNTLIYNFEKSNLMLFSGALYCLLRQKHGVCVKILS
jgi:hypothetical protein